MLMKVRTRYAPSPTGYFHIGGARTALFNFLFAKHKKGSFILRIEDTDIDRNVEGGIESQINYIDWMGFSPDESPLKQGNFGPYQQTLKLDKYKLLANKLLEEKKAYRCFCSKSDLDKQREECEKNHQTPKYNRHCLYLSDKQIEENLRNNIPFTIRLKIDEGQEYSWNDLIRGKITIPGSAMTDPVILKSNGIAMYNFAVVIDDYDMQISHVLRGEEHISNTPYQIAIKKALGYDNQQIEYGHLSIIINDEGKKLSKRDTNLKQFISDYQMMGYLPIAIVNFLCLLGWSPSNNIEIMNLDEMISNFNINDLSKSPAKFDVEKMNWIANQHFKKMNDDEYLKFVKKFVNSNNEIYLKHQDEVLLLFKNQISYAMQLDELINDLFSDKKISDESRKEIIQQKDNFLKIGQLLISSFNSLNHFDLETIKNVIEQIKNQTNLKGKDLFMPIRILATKKTHGPELAKTLFLFGKEKIIDNINKVLEEI